MVENPPANAGDMGSIAGPGRSHMPQSNWARELQLLSLRSRVRGPQLLSPCVTAAEAQVPGARALQQREATAMRGPRTTTRSSPSLPQLEKAHAQQRGPNTAKNK